jgi:hypothetical protein
MNAVASASALAGHRAAGRSRLPRGLPVLVLLALLPLVLVGFSVRLHDGRIHQIWSGQAAGTIAEAGGYPRWLSGMNGGLGSPAMFYYPVLPYLVAVPTLPVFGAAKVLAFGVVLSAVIAGFAIWRLLRRFVQPSAALAGAVLYVTAPYYLGTDLYTRGAYAEYWAFAWLPVVLLGVVKLRGSGVEQPLSANGDAVGSAAGSFPLTSAFAPELRRDAPALSLGEREAGAGPHDPSRDRKGDIPVAPACDKATGVSPFHWLGGVLLLAFGYGVLVATHLPTTLVFSLVPLALATVPVEGTRWGDGSWRRWRPFTLAVLGMALGVGLAAPYLIPAMLMQEHVSMAALTSFHKYNHNFFFGEVGWGRLDLGHEFKQTLYLPFLATAVMGLMGFLLARGMTKPDDQSLLTSAPTTARERGRLGGFFLALLLASVFMMLPVSDFVWRLVPKLQIIQFPWRICSVLTVAAVVLVAFGLDAVRSPLTRRAVLQLYFLVVAFVGGLAYTGEAIWKFIETAPQAERVQPFVATYRIDVPEYRPRWARQELRTTVRTVRRTPADLERERGTTHGVAWVDLSLRPDDPLIGAQTIAGRADLAVLQWQSRTLRLACANERPVTLHVSQLYFPGWTARRDGQVLPLRPSEPAGLLEIDVPAGEGEIVLTLEPLWPERAGNRVGLASAGVWLAGGGWLLGRRKFKAESSTEESA